MSSRNSRVTAAARARLTGEFDRVIGVLMVLAVVGVVTFAYQFYVGNLTDAVNVTLRANRAGLLLDRGARVSVRGVQVGTVYSVTADGQDAVIHLQIDPAQAQRLPTNVVAALRPTTLFGAKYVALSEPANPAPGHLEDGDQIQQAGTSIETDQVFQKVLHLLTVVQPQKVNATLAALSGALGGRGQKLGETITRFNIYLVAILPSMDTLGRDLVLANKVMPTYQTAAPDLISAMDNFSTTSRTLTSQQTQITTLLNDLSSTGGQATSLLYDAGPPLTSTVRNLSPTTAALRRYSPEFPCLFGGLANLTRQAAPMTHPGIVGANGFLPPARAYHYPEDLPKVAADVGPACYGLPDIGTGHPTPHYNFDVGRSPYIGGIPAGGGP